VLFQEIIHAKCLCHRLSDAEIQTMVDGITDGAASEGQVAAFAMAVLLNGMETEEVACLTCALRDSGSVLSWDADALGGPVLDKHSTGGVGDKVSLMLAPMIAAAGGFVPMISGRGLGHTGGTLDKLDAIPGYESQPGLELLRRTVQSVGCAIIGQTDDLAPADRRLYAIRDVTGTVESVPLITASILSKKLAEGLDGLVIDVKTGSGAFLPGIEPARTLARSIIDVATSTGASISALLTDMNQVLGRTAGNAIEVTEAIDFLTGDHRENRLEAVTVALAGEMLALGGLSESAEDGESLARRVLDDGSAAERFASMVRALGGPGDLIERPAEHLAAASVSRPVTTDRGYVSAIDVREVGVAVIELGGGRRLASDEIDPAVGLTDIAGIGEEVGPDAPLSIVHARTEAMAEEAVEHLRRAYTISPDQSEPGPAVIERMGATGS
jgi:thymidine phosphorylase